MVSLGLGLAGLMALVSCWTRSSWSSIHPLSLNPLPQPPIGLKQRPRRAPKWWLLFLLLAFVLIILVLGLNTSPPTQPLGWDQDQDSLPKWWLCCPQSPNWRPPLLSSHPQLSGLGRLSHFIAIFKTNKFLWSKAPKKPNRNRKYHDNYSKLLVNGCSL